MTSHFIQYFQRRAEAIARHLSPPAPSAASDAASPTSVTEDLLEEERTCAFCRVIRGEAEAFKVYEDEHCLALLDILPIRKGHTLVVPKRHYEKVTDMPADASAKLALRLPMIARGVCAALGTDDRRFNIVSNNGHAQVVPHVHWHVVPAPSTNIAQAPKREGWASLFDREELDDETGAQVSVLIREAIEKDTDYPA